MRTLRLILLGPPASGKGTQGYLIAERWLLPVTSVGEVLRQEKAAGTPLGVEADKYTAEGRLVPDRIALDSTEGWIAQHLDGFVIDGFPRTVGQAKALEDMLARRGAPLTAVIWLEVGEDTTRERVSKRVVCSRCGRTFRLGWQVEHPHNDCPACGGALQVRKDDQPDTLTERMTQYREHTEPLMEFYEQRGLLRRIDAGQEMEAVFAQIEVAVGVKTEAAA